MTTTVQTLFMNPFTYVCIIALLGAVWYFVGKKKIGVHLFVVEKIGTPPSNSLLKKEWISSRSFEKKLNYFLRKKYTFLTLEQLANSQAEKSVLLVCMGGYRSFYTTVFPLIQKHNLPVTIFIAPDLIGTYNSWQDPYQEPWQDLLTAKEINQLKQCSFVYWGALPLGGQNITACSNEHAVFAITESIYRLKNQWGISSCAWSLYPNLGVPPTLAQALTNAAIPLPFFAANRNQ